MASGAVQIGEVGSAGVSAAVSAGRTLRTLLDPGRYRRRRSAGRQERIGHQHGSRPQGQEDRRAVQLDHAFPPHDGGARAGEGESGRRADPQHASAEVRAAWRARRHPGDVHLGPGAGRSEEGWQGDHASSGQISASTGKATFDGYIANKDWAKANKDFMVKFTKLLADSDAKYRNNTAKWTADSPEVKAVAKWSGAKPEDVPAGMALYRFPTAQDQVDQVARRRQEQRRGQARSRRPPISSCRRSRSRRRSRLFGGGQSDLSRQKPRSDASVHSARRSVDGDWKRMRHPGERRDPVAISAMTLRKLRPLCAGATTQVSSPRRRGSNSHCSYRTNDAAVACFRVSKLEIRNLSVNYASSGSGTTPRAFQRRSRRSILATSSWRSVLPAAGRRRCFPASPGSWNPRRAALFSMANPLSALALTAASFSRSTRLMPWLNVVDNVEFRPRMRGMPKHTSGATSRSTRLRLVGLEKSRAIAGLRDLRRHAAARGLARALASDPEVMLDGRAARRA